MLQVSGIPFSVLRKINKEEALEICNAIQFPLYWPEKTHASITVEKGLCDKAYDILWSHLLSVGEDIEDYPNGFINDDPKYTPYCGKFEIPEPGKLIHKLLCEGIIIKDMQLEGNF